MSQLQIIKASAGSGKTFSLTGEYLKIILNEPLDYYRKILAVTFTNKATAEMKSRILEELYLLGYGKPSNHLPHLIRETVKDEKSIRDKSKAILNQILHGYSWFKVETIDSFFQGVIRSFIHELGIPGNQTVELDISLILDEAIDRFLESTGNNPQVTEWLLEYVQQKISEGRSWIIKHELNKLGSHLFKEKIKEHAYQLEEHLESSSIKEFRTKLLKIRNEFEQKIQDIATKAVDLIHSNGFSVEDFAYGKGGAAGYFYKVVAKNTDKPGKRCMDVLEDPEKWVTKKAINRELLLNFAENKLNKSLKEIIAEFNNNGKAYFTTIEVLKNFHILGILFRLNHEMRELQKEKNLFFISDAAPFIFRIINNNDTPFIYEKIGNHFNHLLIDEFQDTSGLQWKNFSPLISNSLSMGHECLLVGDIKQSIYRWRNSNWEILASEVRNQYQDDIIKEKVLEENYRSDALIVEFNNTLFSRLPEVVSKNIANDFSNFFPISSIYSDAVQKLPVKRKDDLGYVKFKFFDRKAVKGNETYYFDEVISAINQMLNNGFKPGDIALLVRTKAEGSTLANFLIEANKEQKFTQEIGVISNESLFLNGAISVKMLVAALKYILDSKDKIAIASLISGKLTIENLSEETVCFPEGKFSTNKVDNYFATDFSRQCAQLRMENLYLMVVQLITLLGLDKLDTEKVYIHSFLELVFQFSTSELSDLSGFLKFWEEEGSSKSISAAESDSSVKILTIHKSKGLQFPAVIIPFADWNIEPKNNEILWVEPKEKPFDDYTLLPVNITKSLAESYFSEDYNVENYNSLIDNLNLAYVAFTRPESALFVISRFGESEKKTMGDILYASLKQMDSENTPKLSFQSDSNVFELSGQLVVREDSSSIETQLVGKDIQSGEFPKIRISTQSSEYIREKNLTMDAKSSGKILHAIMEKIKVRNDISKTIDQFVIQGIISKTEGQNFSDILHESLSKKEINDWFSGDYDVINENDIIGTSGKIKRPDRIMIKEKTAIVVDYKFGKEEDSNKHVEQVKQYLKLLLEMGYTEVIGYLWYVLNNDLEEVKL